MLSSTNNTVSKDMYIYKSVCNPILEANIVSDVEDNKSNKVVAEAVFQKCNSSNANGHAFSKPVLENMVNEAQTRISERNLKGELDHPQNIEDVNRIATVMLSEASHLITDLKMDGDYVVGKFETLGTPKGLTLASLLRENVKVGVSIRAITDQDISYGMDDVNQINDFTLITYDCVDCPAYKDAYVKSILSSCVKLPSGNYKVKEEPDASGLITVTKEELTSLLENAMRASIHKFKKGLL